MRAGDEQPVVLQGGVGNAGAVVRVGDRVRRPAGPHANAIHELLRHVRAVGVGGVPEPLALSGDGYEWLRYIDGDVPIPPFPQWSQTDTVLASTAALLRRFHDATVGFLPAAEGCEWSAEMADPTGPAEVVCHNDVCPENVVYRGGEAAALLDFEFAAPGRRVHDVAAFARMCVPIETDQDAAVYGRGGLDPFTRLRVVADAYGMEVADRAGLVAELAESMKRGGQFVRRRIEAGEAAFIEMWERSGGQARFDRRREWFDAHYDRFLEAVG